MINFNLIYDEFSKKQNELQEVQYYIPGAWVNSNEKLIKTNIYDFFINQFQKIKDLNNQNNLSQRMVYNMLLRYSTAFPHKNGSSFSNSQEIYNENGSILKAISLLPYICSLGCNTLYLLPITEIGIDNRKGNLGSPYAIKNHYKIDSTLNEPFLDIPIDLQFSALIEACKILNIKVILEFVFRTASIDNDIALKHPDWFYWIKDNSDQSKNINQYFKPANFEQEKIDLILNKINSNDLNDLPKPENEFIDLFQDTPSKVNKENNRIIGIQNDNSRSIIPSAFADWPPNDKQPLWSDVTYLKMHNNPEYNYIAYNTIRMYDNELNDTYANLELWNYLQNIIPYYQEKFGIDGVMIDMGHALPYTLKNQIISKSRLINSEFILWEENFSLSEESVKSGYNASLGYYCFDSHNVQKIRELIGLLSRKQSPIEFFLTTETHNTKRCISYEGNDRFSKMMALLTAFLPGIYFIHSGFEFGESEPINTGLGFSEEEISRIDSNKLPLFSKSYMTFFDKFQISNLVKSINKFKISNSIDLTYKNVYGIELLDLDQELISYILKINNNEYYILINYSKQDISLKFENLKILITTDQNNKFIFNILNLTAFSGVVLG